MKSSISTAASLILLSPLSFGAITYVDANPTTNTFATATGSVTAAGTWWDNGTQNANALWAYRGGTSGHNGTILEGRSTGDLGAPITTRLSGLDNGIYDVWVFFRTNNSLTWEITAGLTVGSLVTYSVNGTVGDNTSAVAASTLTFTDTISTGGGEVMYGVNLGQRTVTGGSSIDVLIEHLQLNGNDNTGRTWYDGVGYEAIPEPSTALLGGLGMLALLRRRR